MVFHWSLSDSKSPQISRTLLCILVDLNNYLVLIVSTLPLISKSSSSFINPSLNVTRAPITIGINVTFIFHSFYQFHCKFDLYIFIFILIFMLRFIFFQFYSRVRQDSKVHNFAICYKVWSSGRDSVICCMSKSHRCGCAPFPRTDVGLCIYDLLVWSNLIFLHHSQWITLLTHSCLLL